MAQLVSMMAALSASGNVIAYSNSLPNGGRSELEVAANNFGKAIRHTLPVKMIKYGLNGACSVVEGFMRGICSIYSGIDRALTPQMAMAQEVKLDEENSVIPELNKIGLPLDDKDFKKLVESKITFIKSGYKKKQQEQLKQEMVGTILKIRDYSYNEVEAANAEIYFTKNPNAEIIVAQSGDCGCMADFNWDTSKIRIFSEPNFIVHLEYSLRHEFTHAADATINEKGFDVGFIRRKFESGERAYFNVNPGPCINPKQLQIFFKAANKCIDSLKEFVSCVKHDGGEGCDEVKDKYDRIIKERSGGHNLTTYFFAKATNTLLFKKSKIEELIDKAVVREKTDIEGLPVEVIYVKKGEELAIKASAADKRAIALLAAKNLKAIESHVIKGWVTAGELIEKNAHLSGYLSGVVADRMCPDLQKYRKKDRIGGFVAELQEQERLKKEEGVLAVSNRKEERVGRFVARIQEQEKMKEKASSHQDL